jgi:hypothetical protein
MTIFYFLRFETSPTWRTMSPYLYPPGIEWPGYTLRHWVPFSSSPTTCRATMEVVEPASTRLFCYCLFLHCQGNNVSTKLFPSNGCFTVVCLHSCYFGSGSTCHSIVKCTPNSCPKWPNWPGIKIFGPRRPGCTA